MRLQCAGTFCAHSFNSRDFFILFRQMETNFPSHCTIIHYVHLIYLLKFGFSSVSLFAMSDICFFFHCFIMSQQDTGGKNSKFPVFVAS